MSDYSSRYNNRNLSLVSVITLQRIKSFYRFQLNVVVLRITRKKQTPDTSFDTIIRSVDR